MRTIRLSLDEMTPYAVGLGKRGTSAGQEARRINQLD